MSPDDPVIRASHLGKRYISAANVTVDAVADVSFDARAGEVVMIVGPSGSGKTTLLSLVGCLLRPSAGFLRLAGVDVGALNQRGLTEFRLRNIGFVFQSYRLIDALTVQENVELPLDLARMPRPEYRQRATQLLEELDLGHRAKFFPDVLSGGEKQRVAIARALALAPPIVLADEPTGSLDSQAGQSVVELLCRMADQRGMAVVIVSHDLRIQRYAHRILNMEDGRLLPLPDDGVP